MYGHQEGLYIWSPGRVVSYVYHQFHLLSSEAIHSHPGKQYKTNDGTPKANDKPMAAAANTFQMEKLQL